MGNLRGSVALIGILAVCWTGIALATPPPPSKPPQTNPHPPATARDKERVAFAERAVRNLLIQVPPLPMTEAAADLRSTKVNIDQECIARPECIIGDATMRRLLTTFTREFGRVRTLRHTHIIPWSMERFIHHGGPIPEHATSPTLANDEYLVHGYVRVEKNPEWHALHLIVGETPTGALTIRGFFLTPLSNLTSAPPC